MPSREPRPANHPKHLWRNPEPKHAYDVVIIGGGGHGLATAYYLAKRHGITNVVRVLRPGVPPEVLRVVGRPRLT